jgi:4-hydroxybenzoate polyprenyltransferase
MAFLKLIRWPNLLMMSGSLLLIRYTFFVPLGIPYVLDDLHFALLVLSTACIGAAGYIVNDLYDLENDRINKPNRMQIGVVFNERFAWNAFYALFLIGGALGWYLGQHTGKMLYGAINLITGFWLYLYAADFKGRPLLGNVMISFLSAGVLTYPLFFDVLPRFPLSESDSGHQALLILGIYFCLAFVISWLRELIKDMEDETGDRSSGLRTMPIAWGSLPSKILIGLLGGLLVTAFGWAAWSSWQGNKWSSTYIFLALFLPSLWVWVKSFSAHESLQFRKLSIGLKVIMAAAILSIPVITYSSI